MRMNEATKQRNLFGGNGNPTADRTANILKEGLPSKLLEEIEGLDAEFNNGVGNLITHHGRSINRMAADPRIMKYVDPALNATLNADVAKNVVYCANHMSQPGLNLNQLESLRREVQQPNEMSSEPLQRRFNYQTTIQQTQMPVEHVAMIGINTRIQPKNAECGIVMATNYLLQLGDNNGQSNAVEVENMLWAAYNRTIIIEPLRHKVVPVTEHQNQLEVSPPHPSGNLQTTDSVQRTLQGDNEVRSNEGKERTCSAKNPNDPNCLANEALKNRKRKK